MQNQQLSDVKGKELVAAGHAFAKAIGMDTPLIEIAKMVSELATRLDCALVRGDDLQMQRDALAAENAALKSVFTTEEVSECVVDAFNETAIMDHDWNDTGEWSWVENDTDVIRAVLEAIKPETPATDAYFNSVRAEGVEILTGKLQQLIDEGTFDAKEIGVAAGAVYEGAQIAAQLRAGKDGE